MDEKTENCQCGTCRWYDGIGDSCAVRPGGRCRMENCDCWEPDKTVRKRKSHGA